MKNPRLILAIISNIIYATIIAAVILWGFPRIGIIIPLYGLSLILATFVLYSVFMYKLGSRILIKKEVGGFTNMIGMEGRVVKRLSPEGLVRINGELWAAKAESGSIDSGAEIIAIQQSGMKLTVRLK